MFIISKQNYGTESSILYWIIQIHLNSTFWWKLNYLFVIKLILKNPSVIELNNFDAVQNNLLHHIINWLTDEILKCHVFKSEYNNSNFIGFFALPHFNT